MGWSWLPFVLSTVLIWALLSPGSRRDRQRIERIQEVTPLSRPSTAGARARILTTPLLTRLTAKSYARWLAGNPETGRWRRAGQALQRAGIVGPGTRELYGLSRILLAVVLALTSAALGGPIAGTVGGAIGFILPGWIVKRRGDAVQGAIARTLPDVLDLWIACLEAGQGFEAAVHRLVSSGAHLAPELAQELAGWQHAVAIGAPRREMLLERARVLGNREWEAVVTAWIQAEATGVGVARTLRGQRDRIREERRQRARTRALEAPVKLLFPLAFCVFPALFVVTLAPAVLRLWELFSRNPVH